MPRHRPLLFTVSYREKPFRDRHWYVSGFTGEKRIQLWFKSEKEAKGVAADRNADIKANGTQIALDPVTRIQALAAAERLAAYGKSIPDAVSFYCDHLDVLASSISVNELCARIRAEFDRRLTAKEITLRYTSFIKESLKKFTTRFGDRPIKLLADGKEIKAWLATEPLAVGTRNQHLKYIHLAFNLAREWNLLDAVPFEGIKAFYDAHAKARQVQILSPEQCTTSLNALNTLDPHVIPFFALCAFTGLRKGEVSRLDWSEVKLDRDLIDLPFAKSKNRRRKLIEVPENLKAWLAPFARAEGPVKPRKSVGESFRRATARAGIVPWPQNGLRHSFCSYAVALKGFDWTANQADHSVAMLRQHYWEVVDKETAERYWAIAPNP
jgi:integrase